MSEPGTTLLSRRAVRLDEAAADRDSAIRRCGEILVELGAVAPGYIPAMLDRERSISTYMGEGVAIPHGTQTSKSLVHKDCLTVVRFPSGVDWDGRRVQVCVAIAAVGDGHLALLSALAEVLLDPGAAQDLREATDIDTVIRLLEPVGKDSTP